MKSRFFLIVTLFAIMYNHLFAQDDWKISRQIQLRSELGGRVGFWYYIMITASI